MEIEDIEDILSQYFSGDGAVMGRRDELLNQKKEREEAIKAALGKYKVPDNIKYNLRTETDTPGGYIEYFPNDDTVVLSHNGLLTINGTVLKSLRDALNKLLDE